MFDTNYIWLLLYGLVAGVVAKALFPGKDEGGLLLTALLGVMGSVVGGFLFEVFGVEMGKGFSLSGIVPAVFGTLVVLTCWKFAVRFFKS